MALESSLFLLLGIGPAVAASYGYGGEAAAFHAAGLRKDPPLRPDRMVNVLTDFNATGDGNTDDYVAVQAAIDFARKMKLGLYFPSGKYSVSQPLDFGTWRGIFVEGGEASDNALSGFDATVRLIANLVKGANACFDFSGAGYGHISGLAFEGSNCKVMVLNARTSGSDVLPGQTSGGDIYGSDLVYERCNFAGAPVAAFANHMGEVLTWRDCKFHNSGAPGLLLTWRLDDPDGPWKVPGGIVRNFTHGITLTMFRMYGGELTGDNSASIVLDMDGTPGGAYNPDFSPDKNAATFSISGTYFAQVGNHMKAIEVRGKWRNVMIDGNRAEYIPDPPNAPDPVRFLNMYEHGTVPSMLEDFRLMTYGDGDAVHPIIGGNGYVRGGEVIGSGIVKMGSGSELAGVSFHTDGHFNMSVDGDVVDTSVSSGGGFRLLNVTGKLDLDDGGGAPLVHHEAVGKSGGNFLVDPADLSQMLQSDFDGAVLMLHCAASGSRVNCAQVSALASPDATGNLTWSCQDDKSTCNIKAASLSGASTDFFTVRRFGNRRPRKSPAPARAPGPAAATAFTMLI